ncbi:hypothetical protein [Flammeovirga sp. SubArs3]|uniref:hypothetical protein n=1 Tax=Flammeovirga sp. SubArs3 TaxID=2995316 RepID=UPI00248AEAB8|nr:hypothetical protein [Flammeovirga sp. SubArs3]
MHYSSICLIIPISDTLPVHFPLFIKQLSLQKNLDVLLISNFNISIQLPQNISSVIIDFKNNKEILHYLSEQKSSFIEKYTYWILGSCNLLYGQLNYFVRQLPKYNSSILLKVNKEELLITQNNHKNRLDKIQKSTRINLIFETEAKSLFYCNNGKIVDYHKRIRYPFINLESLFKFKNVRYYDSSWKKIPNTFYVDDSGFYNSKTFKHYHRNRLKKEIIEIGSSCKQFLSSMITSNNKEYA